RHTLVNALLYHCRDLSGIGGILRPGIVHRIDKGTSGLLVVAKNDTAHLALAKQFKTHTVLREYLGLVHGVLVDREGTVNAPIGRHITDRKKMSVRTRRGRVAVTCWRVERLYPRFSLVRFSLKTGRTHQIRVHMKEIGHPIVGDRIYGSKTGSGIEGPASKRDAGRIVRPDRPFLHAEQLGFVHPRSGLPLRFQSPLPAELQAILAHLERVDPQ
ncbi:MAG: RluA family pseudouridine synthase, partial [Rubrivivax sp.]|nr:RluA family pseudouridine synthase [Rubrivivax sp.]